MGRFQSGQMGQTVNLLRHRFGGSNPSAPTNNYALQVETHKKTAGKAEAASGFFVERKHESPK